MFTKRTDLTQVAIFGGLSHTCTACGYLDWAEFQVVNKRTSTNQPPAQPMGG